MGDINVQQNEAISDILKALDGYGTGTKVKVNSSDVAGYLNTKIIAGSNITITEGSSGGVYYLTIDSPDQAVVSSGGFDDGYNVKVSDTDGIPEFLEEKLVAGTNITITKSDQGGREILTFDVPDGTIAGGSDVDGYNVKISSTDTTADFLESKLVAGENITITKSDSGGVEILTIAGADVSIDLAGYTDGYNAKVSSSDTTPQFLQQKLIAGSNITITKSDTGGVEILTFDGPEVPDFSAFADGYNVKISSSDTTPGFLDSKLIAGDNVTLTKGDTGGNEYYTIDVPYNTLEDKIDGLDNTFQENKNAWNDIINVMRNDMDGYASIGTFVPYEGATATVDLNTQQLLAGSIEVSTGATYASGTQVWSSNPVTTSYTGWEKILEIGAGYKISSIACSSDSQYIAYIAYDISLSASYNLWISDDYGATFAEYTSVPVSWNSKVLMSTDGSTILVSNSSSDMVVSTDFGSNWATLITSTVDEQTGLSMSDDASVIYAELSTAEGFGLHISTNSGTSWSRVLDSAIYNTTMASCSSDGATVVVGVSVSPPGGRFVFSTNSGTDFSEHIFDVDSSLINQTNCVRAVKCSQDGTTIAVVYYVSDGVGHYLSYSNDSGATWTDNINFHDGYSSYSVSDDVDIEISSDNSKIAILHRDNIHVSQSSDINVWAAIPTTYNGHVFAASSDFSIMTFSYNNALYQLDGFALPIQFRVGDTSISTLDIQYCDNLNDTLASIIFAYNNKNGDCVATLSDIDTITYTYRRRGAYGNTAPMFESTDADNVYSFSGSTLSGGTSAPGYIDSTGYLNLGGVFTAAQEEYKREGDVVIGGNLEVEGKARVNNGMVINEQIDFNCDLLPGADDGYSIGSPNRKWKSIYVTEGSVHVNDHHISSSGKRLTIQNTMQDSVVVAPRFEAPELQLTTAPTKYHHMSSDVDGYAEWRFDMDKVVLDKNGEPLLDSDRNYLLAPSGNTEGTRSTLLSLATVKSDNDTRWSDSSQQRQDIRDALDGYEGGTQSLSQTVTQHWTDSSEQRQSLRDACDGYQNTDYLLNYATNTTLYDFQTGGIPDDFIQVSGSWSITSYKLQGTDALQAEIYIDFDCGDGYNFMSFDYVVSYGATPGTFTFYVDGDTEHSVEGAATDSVMVTPISQGRHRFKWFISGPDTVTIKIDNVVLHADNYAYGKVPEILEALDGYVDITDDQTIAGTKTFSGSVSLAGAAESLGFYGSSGATKPEITGARDNPEEALKNLLTALANLGIITDSTTAS